jgi:hypothetical protein
MRDTQKKERGDWLNRLALILCTILFSACIAAIILYPQQFGGVDTGAEGDGPPTPVPQGVYLEPGATLNVNIVGMPPDNTPTPTETPVPRPTPNTQATPVLDFCGAVPPKDGLICRVPYPTATPSPPWPACDSPEAVDGAVCQYRFTPTPEPLVAIQEAPTMTPTIIPGLAPTSQPIPDPPT